MNMSESANEVLMVFFERNINKKLLSQVIITSEVLTVKFQAP